MKTKTIKQKISFKATAHEVYEALMDSKKHSAFTGGVAKISRKIGGSFSVYDGYATGKNIELIEDKKIVQSWCAADWNDDEISEVQFIIDSSKNGSVMLFQQNNVPIKHFSSIKQGWIDFYWKPLKKMLNNA